MSDPIYVLLKCGHWLTYNEAADAPLKEQRVDCRTCGQTIAFRVLRGPAYWARVYED